jgi:hypothetical protein
MKFPVFIYSLMLCVVLSACWEETVASGAASEETKFLNFTRSMENGSTFQYFTVIEVKNLNTDEVKEICTKGNFLQGALYKQYGKDYKKVYESKKRSNSKYFEFRDKEALENISFNDYNPKLVKVVSEKYNINRIIDTIEKKGKFGIGLNDDEMKAMAHALFNKGYLTGENSCFGGSLIYVSEADLKEKEETIKKLRHR